MIEERDDENITRKLIVNSLFGISSTIIASLLIGVYLQIGSASQEIIRLQVQVNNLQDNVSQWRNIVGDVKTSQVRIDAMDDRLKRLEDAEGINYGQQRKR